MPGGPRGVRGHEVSGLRPGENHAAKLAPDGPRRGRLDLVVDDDRGPEAGVLDQEVTIHGPSRQKLPAKPLGLRPHRLEGGDVHQGGIDPGAQARGGRRGHAGDALRRVAASYGRCRAAGDRRARGRRCGCLPRGEASVRLPFTGGLRPEPDDFRVRGGVVPQPQPGTLPTAAGDDERKEKNDDELVHGNLVFWGFLVPFFVFRT